MIAGMWEIDVPVSPETVEHDRPILAAIAEAFPAGVTLRRLEVVIDGRVWEFHVDAFLAPSEVRVHV